ncbi:hypothetical protein AWM75_01150 [Aerococcus urinaehominis]|uniref:Uncharacterized protein n=1 Tax=Aerococcus urinaehominis TaxID=128944 RepID=A0A0X8FJX4_9LACT|nr:BMP family ABC transporter substrate-binding protein [Aerococcus urinaehominis]AMB98683.1 hypothetical protein AWM75_01150 [Aerococcus urinaehominis]SDL98550.1 basic membrane protein A [Aerococcus urinaehominis]
MSLKKLVTALLATATLAACQGQNAGQSSQENQNSEANYKIAMVTDGNGVDDRSFNQSAWEGMQVWAKNNQLPESAVQYYQSSSENDFLPNLNTAIQDQYDIIYGIGFMLTDSVAEMADQHPDQKFGLLDANIEGKDNVVSITFADNESAFLAGVAAASQSKTNKIGFVGGQSTPAVDKFEIGYIAGAKSVKPDIEIDVQYTQSFTDAGVAQQIASAMFANGSDVIFHAAGGAGNGVNTEARNRLESGQNKDIWVIGADRDQHAEGEYKGGNFMLTSTLKHLGKAIEDETNAAMKDEYHGGQHIVSNLENGGVGIVKDYLPAEVLTAVEKAEQDILSGAIKIPESK